MPGTTETDIDRTRRIEYLPLTWLLDHQTPGNPKDHDQPGIVSAMRRLGFADAPILDERTHLVLGGHGRLEACQAMKADGDQPPEGIEVDPAGDWMLPVQRGLASKDDDSAKALVVGLNHLAEKGGWKVAELAEFMVGVEWEGTGFDAAELDDLFATLDGEPVELPDSGADAGHADLPPARQSPPPPPRRALGLRETVLVHTVEQRQEYDELITWARRHYEDDRPALIVLRVLRDAKAAADA